MIQKTVIKTILLTTLVLTACIEKEPFSSSTAKPQLLGPKVISSATFHESVNFYDSDEHVIYFSRSDKEFKTSTLYSSKFEKGEIWSEPKILPFSGEYYDANLTFYPDKETAYFTSKRDPLKKGLSKAWNIWKVEKINGAWGTPEVLSNPINSTSLECCFTVNDKGQAFFASDRNGSWDIYQAEISNNGFGEVKKLSTTINSDNGEWPGFIDNQGNLLAFSSIRKSGMGGDDLYISQKKGESWSKPILLDTIVNSPSYEDNPLITDDGNFLLFSSWKKTGFSKGISNIYYYRLNKDVQNILENK